MTGSAPVSRSRRVMTFRGTITELLTYLASVDFTAVLAAKSDPDVYEWNLTASMSRHPAGKGLGRGV